MGLEGVFLTQTMENFGGIRAVHFESQSDYSPLAALNIQMDGDNSLLQLELMQQV